MKVKIGNTVHDSEIEPILVVLSQSDKENINKMPEDHDMYVSYPEKMEEQTVLDWIKEEIDEVYNRRKQNDI